MQYNIALRWKILRLATPKKVAYFLYIQLEYGQKQRVIVYIDGFNFYFGLKSNAKWKKYYWLDIVKLFEMFMRPNQELVAVKYFSAKPDDIDQSLRQNAFFKPIEKIQNSS